MKGFFLIQNSSLKTNYNETASCHQQRRLTFINKGELTERVFVVSYLPPNFLRLGIFCVASTSCLCDVHICQLEGLCGEMYSAYTMYRLVEKAYMSLWDLEELSYP